MLTTAYNAACHFAAPAAYGSLAGMGLDLLTGSNQLAGSINTHTVRTAAAFTTVNLLWNRAWPETAVGAAAALLVVRGLKPLFSSEPKPSNAASEFKTMMIGAALFGAVGLAYRIALCNVDAKFC